MEKDVNDLVQNDAMNEWESFVRECKVCRRCSLSENRKNVVVGRGIARQAPVLFVGEGPGEQEDLEGEAFVGRAGKLLDLVLEALLFSPEDYYIANVVKCRPPGNRIPTQEEANTCMPWLRYQVKAIRPRIIVCLGATAAKAIVDKNAKITKLRGTWVEKPKNLLIMPTYHPAAVLRDSRKREDFYLDIKKVREKLS